MISFLANEECQRNTEIDVETIYPINCIGLADLQTPSVLCSLEDPFRIQGDSNITYFEKKKLKAEQALSGWCEKM